MARAIWKKWGALAAILAAGLALGVFFAFFRKSAEEPPGPHDADAARPAGFRERALESGLTFRMAFLPSEQGEHFKINLYDHGCGVAVADYNGDGKDDIYFLNQLGSNALYRNKGDGTFEDVTKQAGVGLGDRVCVAAAFGDYDNDGDQDLYVTSTHGGNVLFRNNGNGTFTDVTRQAGLTLVAHSQGAVFFDHDRDGRLDLFVTNSAHWTTDTRAADQRYYPGKGLGGDKLLESPREFNVLYRNNGDGTFTDITARAGLKGRGWSGDAAVLDYDEDGWPDLLVTNMFGPSQLYRNRGDGTFQDVTRATLRVTSYGACGARAFDYDNDGRLDFFLADMHSDMWMGLDLSQTSEMRANEGKDRKYDHISGPAAETYPALREQDQMTADSLGFRLNEVVFGNTFFKNRGAGKFEEVSDRAGMETLWPWGIATGDFDNDGHEDAFLPSGMGYPFYYWPNALMMNNGNGTFSDRAWEFGVEPPARGRYLPEPVAGKPAARSSRSAAVADFDGDGRLDFVVNNFNDQPYYFRNNFPRQNYVAFRLRGKVSNRDAIGAVVKLYVGREVLTRQVCPSGGYLAQSSKTLHFGLGAHTEIDRVEIRWPARNSRPVTIPSPRLNTLHDVTEGSE